MRSMWRSLNMNYVKNLLKILLLAQCLLLFCTCDEKITKEQKIQMKSNLIDFIKCPFNEEFKNNTNLEKYVLKKFGKPDSASKSRGAINDFSEVIADHIHLTYKGYIFWINRGVNKRFEVFTQIYIKNFTGLKYGISKETTVKDIERLFGLYYSGDRKEDNIRYDYTYKNGPYLYHFGIGFRNGELSYISIDVNINDSKL